MEVSFRTRGCCGGRAGTNVGVARAASWTRVARSAYARRSQVREGSKLARASRATRVREGLSMQGHARVRVR